MRGSLAIEERTGLVGGFLYQKTHFWMSGYDVGLESELFERFSSGGADGSDHHPAQARADGFLLVLFRGDAEADASTGWRW